MAPESLAFWSSRPHVLPSPRRNSVSLMTNNIRQKGWCVTSEVRLQKTLQLLSWPFSGITYSGQSQLPCHEHPYAEAHLARNSHTSELKSRSPSLRQALKSLTNILSVISWRTLSQNHQLSHSWIPDPQWLCEMINHCLQPLNLGAIG